MTHRAMIILESDHPGSKLDIRLRFEPRENPDIPYPLCQGVALEILRRLLGMKPTPGLTVEHSQIGTLYLPPEVPR